MITENKDYRLYGPRGCWGTNYTIISNATDTEYLIDIHDVNEDGLDYDELLALDPETFGPCIWKIGNKDSIQTRVDNYTKEITQLIETLLTTELKSHRAIVLEDIELFADKRQDLLTSLTL